MEDIKEEGQGQDAKHRCDECGSTFTRKTMLRRHLARTHQKVVAPERQHVMHKCLHADCTEQFKHITAMLEHLKEKHGDTVDETDYQFDSMEDFKQWKEMEETQNYVFFAKSGTVVAGKHYFVCQRHGSKRAHRSKNEPARKTERRNRRGSVKTNTICPARMTVKVGDSGRVTVKYIYSHNHPVTLQDTVHQPIPASVRDDIKTKLAMGVKETDILKNLVEDHNNADENESPKPLPLKRKYFVTKQQLKGIKRHKYGRKRLDEDDATSVTLKVATLSKDDHDPVLMYKAKGQNVSTFHPDIDAIENSKEVFCLGLQTKEQAEMLMLHGEKLLCIDSIRAIDGYDYKLINLLIADEFNKGYPVGHLITTSMDRVVLKNFFREIKRRVPKLQLSAIRTDNLACFDAVREGFWDESLTNLHSRWYTGCVIRKQIRENATNDNAKLFSQLMQLQAVANFDDFTASMTELIGQYDETCPKLAELLRSYYDNRKQWARCYRDGGLEIEVCCDVLNRHLREYYLQSALIRRIDDLVDLLLTVDNDVYWQHRGKMEFGQPILEKQPLSLHKAGLRFPDRIVAEVEANRTWKIASCPEHFVTLIKEECTEDFCEELCLDARCAGLCQHMYLCTCVLDSVLCEHQHKVHSMRQSPNDISLEQSIEIVPQIDQQSDDHISIAGSDTDHQHIDRDVQQVTPDDHSIDTDHQTDDHDQSCVSFTIHTDEPDLRPDPEDQTDRSTVHVETSDHCVDPSIIHVDTSIIHSSTDQTQTDAKADSHGERNTDSTDQENATTSGDYEVLVFQGAPDLGSSTQEETQKQVDDIMAKMEVLRGRLDNPRVRQLLLPHISESLRQLISQCELLTNADVVQVTDE